MSRKQTYFIFGICLLITSLQPTVKTNLSGTSYNRIQDQKTSIYKERTPWVSVFKSLRAEPRTDAISLNFQYVVPLLDLKLTFSSNSTLTQGNAMMKLEAGTDWVVSSTISTNKSVNYSPGHEISTFFTAMFPTPGASGGHSTRCIGLFDNNNGFAIGTQNTEFGISHIQNGAITFIPQSTFNIDKLDGSGQSNFILDRTKLNIFYIAFGWLGAAPPEFGIATEDGQWVPFHRIRYPNLYTIPSILNPSLPLSMAVSKYNSGSGNLNLQTASWDATITGKEHALRTVTFGRNSSSVSGSTSQSHMTLKNRSSYAGNDTPTTRVRLIYLNVSGQDTSNKMIRIQLFKNSQLTDRGFVNVDDLYSVVATDTTTTSYISTGTLVFESSSQDQSEIWFKKNDLAIDIYPGETLSLGVSESGSGAVTANFAATWEEYL